MATFYGHAPASQPTAPDQPIKMQGFPLPPLPGGAPTPHSSSSLPPASQPLAAFAHLYPHLAHQPHLEHHLGHPPQPGQGPGIDPSILLGFTPAGQHQHHQHHHDLATESHYGSLGNGAFGGPHPGTSVLSDADLDFESVLASLGAAAHQQPPQHQQGHHHQPHARAVYGSHEAHTDIFAAGGMFDQAAMHPPPLDGQQLSPRLQLDRMPSYFTQHVPPPQQQQQQQTQPQPQQHESFPSPAVPSSSSSAKPAERGRGTSSKRSASTERTGRTGRTASTGGGSVGKAPRQSRSRSARRSSSAAGYDRDRPSPTSRESGGRRGAAAVAAAAAAAGAASGTGEEGADPSPAATPGSGAGAANGAIGIPVASSSSSSSSAKAAEHASHHQYAMSLPAYPSTSLSGTPSSLPGGAGGGAWGALAAAHPHAFPAHAFNSASPNGGGGGGVQQQQADPATGWRPSPPPGAAASAPPATGLAGRSPTAGGGVKAPGKKGKGLADVQEEDDGKGDQLLEKRRKRRESHNAVERRRRDNINDRIAELSLLVPETFLVPGSPPPDGSASGASVLPPVEEGPASPAIGALSLMSPGPSSAAVLSGSPASAPGAGFATRASAQQQQQSAAAEKLSAQQLAAKEKPNKGVVLAKSVKYIKYLQQMVELSQQHAVELQRQNAALRDALASSSAQNPHALDVHHPASSSFPKSTAASSSYSAQATNPSGSPASPNTHAHANGAATSATALGLALESPDSNGGGGVASGSFFDFGQASEHGQGGDELKHESADGAGEREEEDRCRSAGGGGGRSARAGERAWTPMLEGLDMEALAALKEEDMDQS
ncbi:hypothetical protein JCM3775_004810 [Rhodotorula graminis]